MKKLSLLLIFFCCLPIAFFFWKQSPTHLEGSDATPLSLQDIPPFLLEAGADFKEPLYLRKRRLSGEEFYEVKDATSSISYSKSGLFLEREDDIAFSDLNGYIRERILEFLRQEYPGSEIGEVEIRKTTSNEFIDVEILHDSSPSGCWELSFDHLGDFSALKVEGKTFKGRRPTKC